MSIKESLQRFRAVQRERHERAQQLDQLKERQEQLKQRLIEGNRPSTVRGTNPFDTNTCINPPRLSPEERSLMLQERRRSEREGGFYGGNTRAIDNHDMRKFTLEWGPNEGEQAVYDHWDRLHCIGVGPINDHPSGYIVHGHDCDCTEDPTDCPLVQARMKR